MWDSQPACPTCFYTPEVHAVHPPKDQPEALEVGPGMFTQGILKFCVARFSRKVWFWLGKSFSLVSSLFHVVWHDKGSQSKIDKSICLISKESLANGSDYFRDCFMSLNINICSPLLLFLCNNRTFSEHKATQLKATFLPL